MKALEWIVQQGLEILKHRQSNRSHKMGRIVPLPGSGRLRLSRSSEGPCAQSGRQAKKASVSSLDFTWNCHSLFKCIQKNNSPWSPAHMLQMLQLLSEANRISRLTHMKLPFSVQVYRYTEKLFIVITSSHASNDIVLSCFLKPMISPTTHW